MNYSFLEQLSLSSFIAMAADDVKCQPFLIYLNSAETVCMYKDSIFSISYI
jgi:hypothetical protein